MSEQPDSHLTEDDIEAYCAARMTPGMLRLCEEHLLLCASCRQRVREMDRFIAELRSALAEEEGSAPAQPIFVDRRGEERDLIRGLVRVSRLRTAGALLHAIARDRSLNGFGLLTIAPLEVGEEVTVTQGGERCTCIVRFCYPVGSFYRVGLERLSHLS